MRVVQVTQTFPGTIPEAERRWYDTTGWAQWIDGLDRVLEVRDSWPAPGGAVVWESGPAGRGRVTERVVAYAPGAGQSVDVDDVSVTGRQSVVFAAVADGVEISLALQYRLKRRSPVSPMIDLLFIRRAMALSLERTLSRFGAQLRTSERARP